MDTLCTLCHQWTPLPEQVPGGNGVHVRCAACAGEIPERGIAHRYRACRLCGQHYLADLSRCPVCPAPGDAVGGAAWLTLLLDSTARPDGLGPAARDWVPLSDSYGLTLWAAYQEEQNGARERTTGGSNGRGPGKTNGRAARPGPAANGAAPGPRPAPAPPPVAPILPPTPAVLFEVETPAAVMPGAEITVVANEGLDGVEYELIQDAARLAEVADLLAAEPTLALDTETTGLDPYSVKLLLIQVATPQKVYVIDVPRVNPLPLKPLFESPRILKIIQNAKFEYEILKHLAGIEVCNLFDTLLAERLLTAGRYGARSETGLRALSQHYLGITMDKTARKGFIGAVGDQYLEPAQLLYAARDAEVLFGIWRQQAALLRKEKLEKVAQLEFQCVPAVGDMELAGVQVDAERWRQILVGVAVQRDQAAAELYAMLDEVMPQRTMFGVSSINLNSNQQLMDVFRRLGVDLEDTSEATLTKVQSAHPAVAKLLEYRTHEKTLSAFGEHILGLINPATGRIHPDFQQYGADTGRFSCTKPNVQQIPATSDFRSCFVAAPGYKLITCVAEGTRVAAARGLLPVEQVVVGDQMMQEDGSLQPVQRVIDQGIRETVTLKSGMGYELTVTPEHRIRVLDGNGEYVWREVQHLQPDDQLAIKLGMPITSDLRLPLLPGLRHDHFNAVNHSLPTVLSPDLALLMGYITGDGTFCSDYVGFVVADKDEDLMRYLLEQCVALFGYHPRPLPYRGVYDVRIYSKQIKHWLQQIGSAKDHVPEFLWTVPPELIAAYLRGLFEADGSVQAGSTGRVSFSTVHEQLAREVQELLALLGVAAVRSKLVHGKGRGFIWIVTIPAAWKRRFQERVGFISSRKTQGLADLLALPGGSNGHDGVPNMRLKLGQILKTADLPLNVATLLRNARNRNNRLSPKTLTLLKEQHPQVFSELGIEPLLSYSMIFDKVASVEPGGPRRVYDLTVADTSTFIARGFVNHNCDYSQAELRILAELSEDPGFVSAFVSGGDLHAITASQMFNVPLDQVTKAQRSAAKSINFGLAYGRGAGSLALQLGVSPDEARALIETYFKAYRGVQKWLDTAARQGVTRGYTTTLVGRKRYYDVPAQTDPDYRTKIASIERQAKNSPIQGSNADMTKIALVYLREALRGLDARVVNTVHDEIVVEAAEAIAEEVKHIVEAQMIRAGEQILRHVPVVADAAIGDYWKK
jgi:DNA polymerase I-like protein with 3'-5' exonuclease and polymerase domains/intein/homing endonuclease